jgi:hypothetical protein
MTLPFERKPDWEETEDHLGYTIELRFYKNPGTVSMHAYVTKGGTSVIVPFSEIMPMREFATKEEAKRIGVLAAQREIDAIVRSA